MEAFAAISRNPPAGASCLGCLRRAPAAPPRVGKGGQGAARALSRIEKHMPRVRFFFWGGFFFFFVGGGPSKCWVSFCGFPLKTTTKTPIWTCVCVCVLVCLCLLRKPQRFSVSLVVSVVPSKEEEGVHWEALFFCREGALKSFNRTGGLGLCPKEALGHHPHFSGLF